MNWSGERYWYSKEEEGLIREENTRFEHVPGEEELFCSLFRAAQEGEPYEELRAAELLVEVERHYGVKFGKKVRDNFSRLLTKLGISSVHRNSGNFYRVVRIQPHQRG